jgi:hypothetical protein
LAVEFGINGSRSRLHTSIPDRRRPGAPDALITRIENFGDPWPPELTSLYDFVNQGISAEMNVAGAMCGLWPVISASGAYCRLVALRRRLRAEQVPQAAFSRFGFEVFPQRQGR